VVGWVLVVAMVRICSSGGSFSKVVGVSERVGDAVGDGDDRSTEGVMVGRIEVTRVWNRRGVILVETGVVAGLVVVVGGCLAEDMNGVVREVLVVDEGGGEGGVGVGNAVTTGSSVSSGS